VHFEVFSKHATAIQLCLFDEPETAIAASTHELEQGPDGRWQIFVPDLRPGQLYGYRIDGPWKPDQGHWFNPAKLLLDPAALAVVGPITWNPALVTATSRHGHWSRHSEDSSPFVPRSMVVDRDFDWQSVPAPARSWRETVIYECHVKGMTQLHPAIPEQMRGTYAGLAHDAIIEHLLSLGVTAVELLPVQQSMSEPHLQLSGLSNYFGYNPIGFFAPHAAYSTEPNGGQVVEFKEMVRKFHQVGIEVILDVVLNHTAEGGPQGPTLCLRGVDNRSFYRLDSHRLSEYSDVSGCGNSLDFGKPLARDLGLGCLKYWVEEMHIDGFRFDLATVMGRSGSGFDLASEFLDSVTHDSVLSRAKLIAEPWDIGREGYRLGKFPARWAEWNDRFRDSARGFWRGDRGTSRELGSRLLGSPDIFKAPDRSSRSSVNFVTCHDGFTLEDLVSYERKHNLANGEDNQDGHNHNLSRNWGVEGPTDSFEINAQRAQSKRNLFATLALSEGVPMLSHGDELGRTQMGNNNAYCQDNPITWVCWAVEQHQEDFLEFARGALGLRKELAITQRAQDTELESHLISYHGESMTPADWRGGRQPIFGLLRVRGESTSLLIVNNDSRGHLFELPELGVDGKWTRLLDTSRPGQRQLRGRAIRVSAYSLIVVGFSALADGSLT
jgi:glycogen operon protein